mgnify:FL=1
MQSLILTAIGTDRPGLVEELSAAVAANGGNWLKSRMSHLGGEFAGIVRIQVDEAKETALRSALATLDGLEVTVRTDTSGVDPAGTGELVALELMGADRPGIVSEISRALAALGVNVENLETECTSAPMSGEALFKANAELGLPAGLDLTGLQSALEGIASDLIVDLKLRENTGALRS